MSEHVVKWQGITIQWPRPASSLKGALWRIEELQNATRWMLHEISGGEHMREELRREVCHLENLLTARWNANDARASDLPPCDCGADYCSKKSSSRPSPKTKSSAAVGDDGLGLPAQSAGNVGRSGADLTE